MKCMNPKCDSKEFSMGSMVGLTNKDYPGYHWVECDICSMTGPECVTKEEAKSYFEEKEEETECVTPGPGVYMTNWSDKKANPIADINNFLELDREIPADFSDETKQAAQDACAAWEERRIKEAYVRAGVVGGLLMQDSIIAKCLDISHGVNAKDIQIEDGEIAVIEEPVVVEDVKGVQYSSDTGNREPIIITSQEQADELFGKGSGVSAHIGGMIERQQAIQNIEFEVTWNWGDPVIERNDPSPVPMETYTPKGPGTPMERLRVRQSMGLDRGKGPWTWTPCKVGVPFTDINIAKGMPKTEREIEIPKPLTPGPTQITDSPVPEITALIKGVQCGHTESILANFLDRVETRLMKGCSDRITENTTMSVKIPDLANYQEKCDCGAPARIGATKVECTNPECYHWVAPKP